MMNLNQGTKRPWLVSRKRQTKATFESAKRRVTSLEREDFPIPSAPSKIISFPDIRFFSGNCSSNMFDFRTSVKHNDRKSNAGERL